LGGAEERILSETEAFQTQKKRKKKRMSKKIDIHESKKKRFEHIELPAKLLEYFSQSIKSNINLSIGFCFTLFYILFSQVFLKIYLIFTYLSFFYRPTRIGPNVIATKEKSRQLRTHLHTRVHTQKGKRGVGGGGGGGHRGGGGIRGGREDRGGPSYERTQKEKRKKKGKGEGGGGGGGGGGGLERGWAVAWVLRNSVGPHTNDTR